MGSNCARLKAGLGLVQIVFIVLFLEPCASDLLRRILPRVGLFNLCRRWENVHKVRCVPTDLRHEPEG